ncbi:hypothetical protein RHMOL_Rhmol05G0016200 [Rhododendron molle]|uniref:Uncharacterized protein n=1 Tax=Rhododendron molle TaxID=49168 RepID=A0ACC0NJB5_RHOML|nr:hypothetical protein RHMOL_Rhmol05G0016200 [Rhododendron molle]
MGNLISTHWCNMKGDSKSPIHTISTSNPQLLQGNFTPTSKLPNQVPMLSPILRKGEIMKNGAHFKSTDGLVEEVRIQLLRYMQRP